MKSRTLTFITALSLFAALAIPVPLAAQEEQATQQKAKHSRYVLVDLGTLGGPSSFFPTSPIEPFLDNRGMVVGQAETADLDPNCASPDCHITHGFEWRNGVMTDLGTLPGGSNSAAFVIDDRGLIMGGSDNGVIDPVSGLPEGIAVLWKNGQIISLGTLGGG